ncbi:MAG: cyclodeaminase/cyclohydrolase family protein [Polyangiales bacterium]
MTQSLWDRAAREVLADTASPAPTPGGGAIAPLTGAFGLGLVLMALEVTAAKSPSDALAEAQSEGRQLLDELAAQPDRDVAAFDGFMRALGLPKATDAEKAARQAARDAAASHAARVPLTAAEVCLRALTFAADSRTLVQKNVYSDLLAGADILVGSLKAALRTVDINLPYLSDPNERSALEQHVAQLRHAADAVYAQF